MTDVLCARSCVLGEDMRFIAYGIILSVAALLIYDTNIGSSLSGQQNTEIGAAIACLCQCRLYKDSARARKIWQNNGFRHSRFYDGITRLAARKRWDFAFYAYTPAFSHSHIFLGQSFWEVGTVGKASVITHELGHIRRHESRILGGFPRSMDEAFAYRHQYDTYAQTGLGPFELESSLVFWDMMIGMQSYVLPRFPQYSGKSDILWAIDVLQRGDMNGEFPDNAGLLQPPGGTDYCR